MSDGIVTISVLRCCQDVCEILKNAVRTLLSECASLLTCIASLVINMFQSHPHPVILDISKQVFSIVIDVPTSHSQFRVYITPVCYFSLQLRHRIVVVSANSSMAAEIVRHVMLSTDLIVVIILTIW